MSGDRLKLENVGPITAADLRLGDLTVLVGPQATGKSIFLQFLRLLLDAGPIFRTLRKHGLDWDKQADRSYEYGISEIRWRVSCIVA